MRQLVPVLGLLLLLATPIAGQTSFSANRPGQIDNPDITPPGNIMIETGFQYGKTNDIINYLLPAASVRFGISNRLELSLNAENIYQKVNSLFGLISDNIGSKFLICDERGALPKISFVNAFILPFGELKSFRPEHAGGVIELAASHSIGSRAVVYANTGATWSGNASYPVYNWVATIYFSPGNKLWIFGELYGLIPGKGSSSNSTDFGITWQAGRNLQLDLTCGFDLKYPSDNHFIQLGTAIQIEHKSK